MRELVEWAIIHVPGFGNWWYNTPNAAAWVVGVCALLTGTVVGVLGYQLWRRCLLKQKKFGGRWWAPEEYRGLMQVLFEDRGRGRVLSHEEKVALRQFEDGRSAVVMPWEKNHGGYV